MAYPRRLQRKESFPQFRTRASLRQKIGSGPPTARSEVVQGTPSRRLELFLDRKPRFLCDRTRGDLARRLTVELRAARAAD